MEENAVVPIIQGVNEVFMKSKLILLEGIPGSGKSTAGLNLQKFLENNHIHTRFWREGDLDHPADYEGITWMNAAGYHDLLSQYPDLAALFQTHTLIRGADYLLSYRKLQQRYPEQISQTLMDELSRNDVYDLPMEAYCRLALDRWQDFSQTAEASETVTLLECCLLQNPLTVLFARHNADSQFARQHIERITEIISGLNPLVVYLQPTNVEEALLHVQTERPKEWADFVTWYLTGQAYGKVHHLSGFDGVIQFYTMRQKLEIEMLRGLPVHHLVLEHSGNEWDRCEKELIEFLRLHIGIE